MLRDQTMTWIPHEFCGPFKFGSRLPTDDPQLIDLKNEGSHESDEVDYFVSLSLGVEIAIFEGNVVSIECDKSLVFRGIELIGNFGDEVMDAIGGSWEIDSDEFGGRELVQREVDIIAWEDEGVVTAASVSADIL